MKIIDFTHAHINEAKTLAMIDYEMERFHVPTLPPIDTVPDLSGFAGNGLGVAAFIDNKMVGFLCGIGVWENAWGIQGVNNVFSPMGGNASTYNNRAEIYAAMYQAAAKKWVRAKAASHGICIYAHDKEVLDMFFRYGFGIRCIDAIREMDEIDATLCDGYEFAKLKPEEILELLPLVNKHMESYRESPFFMYRETETEAEYVENFNHESIYFVARFEGKIVAYIMAEQGGETFIQDSPGYIHASGAFCLTEHRRKGISQHLLNLLIQDLKKQGFTLLGVDFESFNPTGSGFWLKHFTAYTNGIVRRIDESILELN